MARLKDVHSIIVLLATIYFALIAVLNGDLAAQGVVPLQTYISAHTLVFVNIFFGLSYLIYVTKWKGDIFMTYEETDWRKTAAFAAIGALLHLLLYVIQVSIFSVSNVAVSLYYTLLGSAYAMVAFTENAFFIGVIGDFVAERFTYSRKGNIFAAIVASLAVMLTTAVFHTGVYGSSLRALAVVGTMFGYWTFASLESRSTLYADFHHAIGNYIGFVYSAVQVVM